MSKKSKIGQIFKGQNMIIALRNLILTMKYIMIFKRVVVGFFIGILFCLILGINPSHVNANDNGSDMPLVINPFSLPKIRAIPGQEFRIEIQKELFDEEIPINKQLQNTKVALEYKVNDNNGLWGKVKDIIKAIENKAQNKLIENAQQIEALKIKEVKELKILLKKIYD